MKKITGAILFVFLLSACGQPDKYQEEISTLSESLEESSASLGNFLEEIEDDVATWKNQFAAFEIDEEARGYVEDEKLRKLDQAKAKCSGHGDSFGEIHSAVANYMRILDEKSVVLTEFMSSIEAGEVREDAEEFLTEMKVSIENVNTKIEEWNEGIGSIQNDCAANCVEHTKLLKDMEETS